MTYIVGLALATILQAPAVPAAAPSSLTPESMATFLRTAKIVHAKPIGKGVTSPWRLTLSDGTMTHDAAFQSVDEHKPIERFASGGTELNFIDSWRYDVAAYRLAELIGLGDMMPVTVERRWRGTLGALSWWLDVKLDEEARLKQKIEPPDREAWARQMFRLRVFSQLVDDTDRNLGNVLITPDWEIRMIDFTRAFRLWARIKEEDLARCDRRLLERLQTLTLDEIARAEGDYLTRDEMKAVIARRDLIVAHVKRLVAERGEAQVLY
jgi:hypothetical protein